MRISDWSSDVCSSDLKVRDSGIHSLMVVPIRARHCVLGLALFGRSEELTPFQDDDLLLAEELVTRAALSLDNALQYARQRTAALTQIGRASCRERVCQTV